MQSARLFKLGFLLFFAVLFSTGIHAQDLLKGKDLSQVKVDQLSNDDIAKLKNQLASANMTIDQAEQMALAKGMSPAEFAKLKERLNVTDPKNDVGKLRLDQPETNKAGRQNNSSDTLNKKKYPSDDKPLIDPLIFGSELYTGSAPTFEPNLKLATPLNYILGPDDVVDISVYGIQQYDGQLNVSPEGIISIPSVGQVKVAGMTIEAATERIRNAMANSAYPYLKNGGSKLSVTLGKIRSIKVTVIGSNFPGTKTLSSLATVYHALFIAGGPTSYGSFREIELWRNNTLLRKIDLYRLMLSGDQSDNIGLKDNDVIRIPPYKKRVELQGQVKRPGIFEVIASETFSNVLAFASGFTDTAYEASVKVYQKGKRERQIHDLTSVQFNSYQPNSGDVFVVSKILNRFMNRVRINGAVFRPDSYELEAGMRASDLIRKADGLKEDAYTSRAQIIRLQDDLTRSVLSFDVRKALAGDSLNNPQLVREDELFIASINDLRDSFKVKIQGEIRLPGDYEYVSGLTVKDLILQAGGFKDAAYKHVEIARLIKRDSVMAADNRASQIINVDIAGDQFNAATNITLEPYDVVTIRRKAGYTPPEVVVVSGQVQHPGPYAVSNQKERVSDVLRRAGGLTPGAYPEGAYLKRYKTQLEQETSQEVLEKLRKKVKMTDTDTTTNTVLEEELLREFDKIPLDLPLILREPGSTEDIIVRADDELFIPKFEAQVKVRGAVLLSTQVPFRRGASVTDYIAQAGGFNGNAWRRKTYIVYANGKAATTKHFLFFKMYPKVQPGSELVIPSKPVKKGASVGEVIGISSALASLAGVVIAILKL